MAMLMTVGMASADNLLVSNVELKAGETKQIAIELNNPDNKYAGFQFDLVLPEGITIAKNNKNKFIAAINEDRVDDHTLTVSDIGNNTYRFLAFSMTNAELYETSGPLVNLTLKADEDITSGVKTASIEGQVFTQVSGTQVKWDKISFSITIPAAVVPEITAENKSREYGEDNPQFTYTASSELNGQPELTTTATTESPVGEYDIVVGRGTIVGDYTSKNGKLTITQAPLTVTAKSYSIKQGDALPEFAATYVGFKNGEDESVLTKKPTLSTSATSASAPGEYDILVSGAEAQNYSFTYVKGTLTITEADPITVTAKSYSRVYGEENPIFDYEVIGGSLVGTPSISCNADVNSPVGEYDIEIAQGSVSSYNVTYVKGKLIITQAPLTITAKSYSIKQGDALPEFAATYKGFKNGENESVLTKKPTLSTAATSASAPGEYDILVSGAEAQNYSFAYEKGTLTVEAIVVTPIEEETTIDTNGLGEEDLTNNVVGDVYYNVGDEGYDSEDNSVVIGQTTNMQQITDATPGSSDVSNLFTGLILKIGAGFGMITISAKTAGNASLAIQIGNGTPTIVQKTEKGDIKVPYNLAEDTYVYVYSTAANSSNARALLSLPSDFVKIYNIKIVPGATGIGTIDLNESSNKTWYTIDGKNLQAKPTKRGIYIVNGEKVIVK